MEMVRPSALSDDQLVSELKGLLGCERATITQVVVHLAEMDGRTIHLAAGFSSLYTYCVGELHLSEYEAYSRIEVARAGQAFPRIFRLLGENALSLTTVQLLARKLTADNHDELLTEAAGRSKSEVHELLARRFPRPDAPATVRKVPPPVTIHAAAAIEAPPVLIDLAASASAPVPAVVLEPIVQTTAVAPSSHRPAVTPLAPDRYRVTFTADAETCEMLDLAKDMLRHAVPSGDTGAVMKRALKTLVKDLTRRRFAATDRSRKSDGGASHSRHVPAAVKRAVWIRDGGRCAFIAPTRRRCNERGFVEFHHIEAYAKGGQATVDNLQLRCRQHNAYEADLEFGPRQARGDEAVEDMRALSGTSPATRSGPSTSPARTKRPAHGKQRGSREAPVSMSG